jgi:hypothetical protein
MGAFFLGLLFGGERKTEHACLFEKMEGGVA